MNKDFNRASRKEALQSACHSAATQDQTRPTGSRSIATHTPGAAHSNLNSIKKSNPHESFYPLRDWTPDFSPPSDEKKSVLHMAAQQERFHIHESQEEAEVWLKSKALGRLKNETTNDLSNEAKARIRALLHRGKPGSDEFVDLNAVMGLARLCLKGLRAEFATSKDEQIKFKLAEFFRDIAADASDSLSLREDPHSMRYFHGLTHNAVVRLQNLRSNSNVKAIAKKQVMWPASISKHPFVTRRAGARATRNSLNELLLDDLEVGNGTPFLLTPPSKDSKNFWKPDKFYNQWAMKIVDQIQQIPEWMGGVREEGVRRGLVGFPAIEQVLQWKKDAVQLRPDSGPEKWWEVAEAGLKHYYPAEPFISANDIVDLRFFKTTFEDNHNPLSRYLWMKLPEAVQREIATYQPPLINETMTREEKRERLKEWEKSDQRGRHSLAEGLNGIIRLRSIYDEARFAGVRLSPETESLKPDDPSGDEIVRVNRLLLRDAYPHMLAPPKSSLADLPVPKVRKKKRQQQEESNPAEAKDAAQKRVRRSLRSSFMCMIRPAG